MNQPSSPQCKATSATRPVFTFFPGPVSGKNATRQEKNEAMKHDASKDGWRIRRVFSCINGSGRPFTLGKWLGIEFVTELVESILVVFLLAQTTIASFAGRVGFVLVAGILAAIATNVSYWNWYGFPCLYTASYMFIQIIGFLVCRYCRGVRVAEARSRSLKLSEV